MNDIDNEINILKNSNMNSKVINENLDFSSKINTSLKMKARNRKI